jgi:hypothetical protein
MISKIALLVLLEHACSENLHVVISLEERSFGQVVGIGLYHITSLTLLLPSSSCSCAKQLGSAQQQQ